MLKNLFEYPFLIRIFNTLLTDKSKINIISVNKFLNKIKFTFSNKYLINLRDEVKWFYYLLINIEIKENFYDFSVNLNKEIISLSRFTNLKTITIRFNFFNNKMNYIPYSVTKLIFNYQFNFNIIKNSIPSHINELIFSNNFNQPLSPKSIPKSVTHLTFGYFFNRSVNDRIPKSITHLTFGGCFNKEIRESFLKTKITHLTFGRDFNLPVKNYIPDTVTHLIFGRNFNKSIRNLPRSIEYLTINSCFKNRIKKENFPLLKELILL